MELSEITDIMKALSNENRIRIVTKISEQDNICACKILDDLGITQPTLSHHMKVLCSCGLVTCYKKGKWMHYSLNIKTIEKVSSFFYSITHS